MQIVIAYNSSKKCLEYLSVGVGPEESLPRDCHRLRIDRPALRRLEGRDDTVVANSWGAGASEFADVKADAIGLPGVQLRILSVKIGAPMGYRVTVKHWKGTDCVQSTSTLIHLVIFGWAKPPYFAIWYKANKSEWT